MNFDTLGGGLCSKSAAASSISSKNPIILTSRISAEWRNNAGNIAETAKDQACQNARS